MRRNHSRSRDAPLVPRRPRRPGYRLLGSRAIRERVLERVERLVAGDLDLEAVAGLLVLDRDRDGVRLRDASGGRRRARRPDGGQAHGCTSSSSSQLQTRVATGCSPPRSLTGHADGARDHGSRGGAPRRGPPGALRPPRTRTGSRPTSRSSSRSATATTGSRSCSLGFEPFDFALTRVERWPTVLWLAPEPAERFVELTRAVAERYPGVPAVRAASTTR